MWALLRRHRWWIALGAMGAMLASWWIVSSQFAIGPSRRTYDRIKLGISRKEVREIIGDVATPDPLVQTFLWKASHEGGWAETQSEPGPEAERDKTLHEWWLGTPNTPCEWWLGKNVAIEIVYSGGKAIQKSLSVRHWPWHPKLQGSIGISPQSDVQMMRYAIKKRVMETREVLAQAEALDAHGEVNDRELRTAVQKEQNRLALHTRPPSEGERMSSELTAFLSAADLDQVGDARENLKTVSPADRAAIRSVLTKWGNAQGVSNLLMNPDLIPEDLRATSLCRGLSERRQPYYELASAVGLQSIAKDTLSDKERQSIKSGLMSLIRNTRDARAERSSATIARFISVKDAPQLLGLLGQGNDTVRTNLRAWLFKAFRGRSVQDFTAAIGQSALSPEEQKAVVREFEKWRAKPTELPVLFAYIPNLADFQPKDAPLVPAKDH